MIRTYRYRLYPTKEQRSTLHDILWAACWLYNRALDYRRKRWSESRKSISYYDQAGMWRDWRNQEPQENPLRLLNMSAGQQVLRRLDTTYKPASTQSITNQETECRSKTIGCTSKMLDL
jgi:putative transposase